MPESGQNNPPSAKKASAGQGVRGFDGNPVHHFAPELFRKEFVEPCPGEGMFGAGRNPAAKSGLGNQSLKMFLARGHGGIKTDNGSSGRHGEWFG
jgi:hypothetical protein